MPMPAFGWGAQHDEATRLAATISLEPFKSNPDLCTFGSYPDALPDHAISYGEDLYLRRLFTFEAIDALRSGDVPKVMFLASAATHFLTDNACIAHAGRAWYHKGLADDPWTKYLPRKYEKILVPREKKQVYYPHLKGMASDTCLLLPEPEHNLKKWREYQGSTNAYFDTMPSVRMYIIPELLRRPVDWAFTDFDQYARWYATFIALDMLDPESLQSPQLKLRDARGMKAVCLEELINGTSQCAAYFGYLCTAANAEVSPSLNEVLPESDKLMALAKTEPVVLISTQAAWPVERAAHVLAMELLRAERRLAKTQGQPLPTRQVRDYVLRVSPENAYEALKSHNALVLLTPDDPALAAVLNAPQIPENSSGIIAAARFGDSKKNIMIILRGATRQDALYLVDYLLDLSWAPVHSPWPAETVVEASKNVWAGWRLLEDLRKMTGQEAVAYARRFPKTRPTTSKEALAKVRDEVKRRTTWVANQEEWWRHFLLELPLPDGRRVPEMLERGTDYSKLLPLVKN
jgi:hypothetical protein